MERHEADRLLAILQVLAGFRRELVPKGASGGVLKQIFKLQSVEELKAPLWFLFERSYINAVDCEFIITDKGLKYMSDLDGDWQSLSFVPRRPLPIIGAGEVALPLPVAPHEERSH